MTRMREGEKREEEGRRLNKDEEGKRRTQLKIADEMRTKRKEEEGKA